MSRSPVLVVLSALLVAACAATPSPSRSLWAATRSSAPLIPATQPPPIVSPATALLPLPTSAPSAGGWPLTAVSKPTFGPDGTAYLFAGRRETPNADQQSLVAIDAAGHMK